MIERLEIDGYRGLDGVRIDSLGHVNVIVGPMNSGKTSLLEAVFLFCSTGDPMLLPSALGLRRVRIVDSTPGEIGPQIDWVWTVGRADPSCEIAGSWCGEERHNRISRIARKGNEIPLQADSDPSGGYERTGALGDALSAFQVETVIGQESFCGQVYVRRDKLEVHADDRPNIKGRFLSPAEQGNSRELAPILKDSRRQW
ncbi:MAG: AAA family ATPase [Phycisphaerales bacterium]|nr:MAG: AAA family ATPase [Phycisphaerales bacterium]